MSEDKVKEKMALWGVTGNRVEKHVGRFTMNGETYTFTVLKAWDLVCLRPLNMASFDWDSAQSTFLRLKTDDTAFEMRRGWTAPGNGTEESWDRLVGRVAAQVRLRASDGIRRFWIIDYRIHLKREAAWPVTKNRKSKMRLNRFHGRVCDYVEVHDVEEVIWDFEAVEGEIRNLRFHLDLGYWNTVKDMPVRTGVIACVARG